MSKIKSLEEENESSNGMSSKIVFIIAIVLLVVIAGNVFVKDMFLGFFENKPATASTDAPKLSITMPDTSWLMAQAQEQSGKVGEIAYKTGKDIGAAVLGEAVGFAEKTASQSANAAANVVIQSTVPGIVGQIDKLPEAQQKEVKKIICE